MRFRARHAGPRAGWRSGDVGRRHAAPQWSRRPTDLESRPTPSTNEAAVVDVQVLDQAAVDRVNASRVLGYRHSDDRLLEPPRWHTHSARTQTVKAERTRAASDRASRTPRVRPHLRSARPTRTSTRRIEGDAGRGPHRLGSGRLPAELLSDV